jgi:hypothetical protein
MPLSRAKKFECEKIKRMLTSPHLCPAHRHLILLSGLSLKVHLYVRFGCAALLRFWYQKRNIADEQTFKSENVI